MSWFETPEWNRIRYTLYSPVYDAVIRLMDGPRRRSIQLLNLRPGARVLIVGCGSGRDLLFLPHDVSVTAGDITPAMVRLTERRARRLGWSCDARVFDAARMPFPDASFDAVLLHLLLAVVPDPQTTIREASRVLKPEGSVAIFDKFLTSRGRPPLLRRVANRAARILFTDINRRPEPLLDGAGLIAVHDEAVMLDGFFRIIIAQRGAAMAASPP